MDHLNRQQALLKYNGRCPETIKIVYMNTKKRFTEFYRIHVVYPGNRNEYFWIRIVKNKSENEIANALNSQFDIIETVYSYFYKNRTDGHFCCCEPILRLLEYNAIITKECKGVLLNDFLIRCFPWFHRKKLSAVFYNCGLWLRHFHCCCADENVSEDQINQKIESFKERHGREPETRGLFLTKCHNDYSPRNIFVSETSVEVIDFVGVQSGFPEEDLLFFQRYFMRARFNGLYSKKMKNYFLNRFFQGYNAAKI